MLRLLALALLLGAALAPAAQAQDRYALANGCYALKAPNGKLVAKTQDGGYRATADRGETFRMQATDLGRYLLYGHERDFLAYGAQQVVPVPVPTSTPEIPPLPVAKSGQLGKRVQSAAAPSDAADWRVDAAARRVHDHAPVGGPRARRRRLRPARPRRRRGRGALQLRAGVGLRRLPRARGQRERRPDAAARRHTARSPASSTPTCT